MKFPAFAHKCWFSGVFCFKLPQETTLLQELNGQGVQLTSSVTPPTIPATQSYNPITSANS